MEFKHISVLLNETIEALEIKPDGIYVDGTAGGAGHSSHIAQKLTTGRLIALDRDPDAIKIASERLKNYPAKVVKSNFADMDIALKNLSIEKVDGILLDLGVSSWQLDNRLRGFSYHGDAPLDMRMSSSGVTAADLVNSLSVDELAKIFFEYGEEKFSYRIANRIVSKREKEPIETTAQLSEIIKESVPAAACRNGHPARKCFQALRIAVNDEMGALQTALSKAFDLLNPGGKLCIITFHSLEDRMVKQFYQDLSKGCICPPDIPVCVCGRKPRGKMTPRKPILPSEKEIKENKRSRSAKLRVITKI